MPSTVNGFGLVLRCLRVAVAEGRTTDEAAHPGHPGTRDEPDCAGDTSTTIHLHRRKPVTY